MKKIIHTIGLVLLMATVSGQALADGGRYYGYRHHHHHRSASDWVAPLIFLGVAGAALSAAANQPSTTYVAPSVTYTTPPVTNYPPQPPANAAYYCASAGQYYPNTPYCPEGWQLAR